MDLVYRTESEALYAEDDRNLFSERFQHKPWLPLYAAVLAALGLALTYSQTLAFHWDEGFHLLAARMIAAGERPYLDFCFPQAPLNAYWNAGWMLLLGERWRVIHAVAAGLTVGAILLMARFLFKRFPVPSWRGLAALLAVAMLGLHNIVLDYGGIAQAYGFCLLMTVAAFRASIVAAERRSWLFAALAGLLAGAAPGSSMLTAAAGPAFLIWILFYSEAGGRIAKFAGFTAGAAVAFAPEIALFIANPHATWFNLVAYQAIYRRYDWPGAGDHDIGVLSSWINNAQDLFLVIFALVGVAFLRRSGWDRRERAPYWLCVWLILAICAQNAFAHPTFSQYFVFTVPFLVALASIGIYATASRLRVVEYPGRIAMAVTVLFLLGMLRGIYDNRDSYKWTRLEEAARKVEEITPRNVALLAPEPIYFLAHRPAPSGMEFAHSHRLKLSAADNAAFHIVPQDELDDRTRAGKYGTVAICDDDDAVDTVSSYNVFGKKADFGECTVFWQWHPPKK